jgi:hypothetical protein
MATFTKKEPQVSVSAEDSSPPTTWKPLKQEYLLMLTISILSLMVALDATILVPVLPVRSYHSLQAVNIYT